MLLVVVVLLTNFAFLLRGASARHLREDEAIAFAGTAGDLASTIEAQRQDVHAPLWFVLFHGWQRWLGMGDDELPSRLFSVLLSMLTLAVVFRVGASWFRGWWAGLCSVVALGTLAYFYLYGLEIRPYALVMLLAALSMWAFERWLRLGTWQRAMLYGLSVAAMLYLHYFGMFLALVQAVYALAWLAAEDRRYRTYQIAQRGQPGTRSTSRLVQGIGAGALAVALWLPWLPTFIAQVRHVGGLVTEAEARAIEGVGMASTTQRTDLTSITRLVALSTNGQPALYGAILFVGFVRWRTRQYWLVVGWGIGVPASMMLVNLLVPVYEPRYASTLVPGLGLLIGASLAALIEAVLGRSRPPLRGGPGILALAIFGVFAAMNAPAGVPNHLPLRDFLTEAERLHEPGDAIYFDHIRYELTGAYLYRKYGPSFLDVLRSEAGTTVTLEALTADDRRPRCVWFITESWFSKPQTRGVFEQIAARRPLQAVIGIQDRYLFQRLCAPPDIPPVVYGATLRFLGAEVMPQTDLAHGGRAITLKLWWDVLKPPSVDYSFSVRLIDPSGATVAQHDGPLVSFYGGADLPTSTLVPGVYYLDLRTLALAGPPAARYSLAVVVYQWWDGQALPAQGRADVSPAPGPVVVQDLAGQDLN
jgi:hypothetical protein